MSVDYCYVLLLPLVFKLSWKDIGKGSGNNYAYLVVDEQSKDAAIIDPANPPEYARRPRRQRRSSLTGPQSRTNPARSNRFWESQLEVHNQYPSVRLCLGFHVPVSLR